MNKFYSIYKLYYSYFNEYVCMMMIFQHLDIIRVLVGSLYARNLANIIEGAKYLYGLVVNSLRCILIRELSKARRRTLEELFVVAVFLLVSFNFIS